MIIVSKILGLISALKTKLQTRIVTSITRVENELITLKSPFIKGVKHGVEKGFYSNGELCFTSEFVDGQVNGISKRYDKNGVKVCEVLFVSGKAIERSEYNNCGWLAARIPLSNGQLNGMTEEFFESGKIRRIAVYKDGELHGPVTTFFEEGELESETTFDEAGENVVSFKQFYPSGKVKTETSNNCTKTFWSSGALGTVCPLNCAAKPEGEVIKYRKDGSICQKAMFRNGHREGVTTGFYPNGRKSVVSNFEKGVKQGIELYYEENGYGSGVFLYKDGKNITQDSLSLNEFRDKGFLQEANRLFFYPLGLSLRVEADSEDPSVFKRCSICDTSFVEGGMIFDVNNASYEAKLEFLQKAKSVEERRNAISAKREERYGWIYEGVDIVPVPETKE